MEKSSFRLRSTGTKTRGFFIITKEGRGELMRTITGAQAVVESLIAEGVEVVFGYPG